MRLALLRSTTCWLLVLCFHQASAAAAAAVKEVIAEGTGHPLGASRHSLDKMYGAIGKSLVATWEFESASGQPDRQGWTTVDLTEQLGTFFHVEDFVGLGGAALSSLSGARSLWIGARPCATEELCSYESLPGYGNNWHQLFESVPFGVTGPVTIGFDIRYDTENEYDGLHLEYRGAAGTWQPVVDFTGIGEEGIARVIEADAHAGSIQFRFRFQSDSLWSDEDGYVNTNGAAIIDNLLVSDANGTVDFQDFEGEATGSLLTDDGNWAASPMPGFGDYAGLFDGATVLQEDPLVTNTTSLWGFFNGSPDTYACGGHPGQAVVPFARSVEGATLYFWNEIRSPKIPLPGPYNQPLSLEFDVYRDLPLDNLVLYHFRIRSLVDGLWGSWKPHGITYYSPSKEWFTHTFDLQALVESGATAVQIGINARDLCPVWCGTVGSGACHSQAPLIDNVRLTSDLDAYVVTNTNDSIFGSAGSLRSAINSVNANQNGGVIHFAIPGAGPHTIELSSDLPSIIRPVVVDGRTQPGYEGTPLVQVERVSGIPSSIPVLRLAGPNSAVFGLDVRRSSGSGGSVGIGLPSSGSIVQGCVISNVFTGIAVSGSNNLIGGINAGEGNEIFDVTRAVEVDSGDQGNRILGNSIHDVLALGIDLAPIGPNANDANDADEGANRGQNHPTLAFAQSGAASTRIVGELASMAARTYRVEFFSTGVCGASGRGLGRVYLGHDDVTLPGTIGMGGTGIFDVELPVTVASGARISATATDPQGNTSEISPCVVAVNTPAGAAVVVRPLDSSSGSLPVTLTFDQVLAGGETTLTITDVNPVLPSEFVSSDGLFYGISTTAQFTGQVEVCLTYDEALLLVPENRLLLFHGDTAFTPAQWTEITSNLDTETNTICGVTDHFSPFALGVDNVTGVEGSPMPRTLTLRQNVPNPFNPTTTISFDVPRDGDAVHLRVYDVAGRLVRTLAEGARAAGTHRVSWDGRDVEGRAVAAGVYYYRLSAGMVELTRRMILLK